MSKEFPWPQYDAVSGLKYLVETPGNRRLYKHPPCRICGVDVWSYSAETQKLCDATCVCHPSRRERNDNEELAELCQ